MHATAGPYERNQSLDRLCPIANVTASVTSTPLQCAFTVTNKNPDTGTCVGVSARMLARCGKTGLEPFQKFRITKRLRLATGTEAYSRRVAACQKAGQAAADRVKKPALTEISIEDLRAEEAIENDEEDTTQDDDGGDADANEVLISSCSCPCHVALCSSS